MPEVDYSLIKNVYEVRRGLYKNNPQALMLFDLLHEARGMIMALRGDFPPDLAPDLDDIDDIVNRINQIVGKPYYFKNDG